MKKKVFLFLVALILIIQIIALTVNKTLTDICGHQRTFAAFFTPLHNLSAEQFFLMHFHAIGELSFR